MDKMEIHKGIVPLMKTLLESCQPSGPDTIPTTTLLQHWLHTVQTSVSTRESFVVELLLDDLAGGKSDTSIQHISRRIKGDRQCYQCKKLVGRARAGSTCTAGTRTPGRC